MCVCVVDVLRFVSRDDVQEFPKKDAAIAAGYKEKEVAKVFKEGGKKGVEIEGAADMSGLTCFCTRIQNAKGEVALLEVAMEGMNAIPDPSDEEERKGCSGHISKILISESEEKGQIAMVAYVADQTKDKLNAKDWLQGVCDSTLGGGVGGTVDEGATAKNRRHRQKLVTEIMTSSTMLVMIRQRKLMASTGMKSQTWACGSVS